MRGSTPILYLRDTVSKKVSYDFQKGNQSPWGTRLYQRSQHVLVFRPQQREVRESDRGDLFGARLSIALKIVVV